MRDGESGCEDMLYRAMGICLDLSQVVTKTVQFRSYGGCFFVSNEGTRLCLPVFVPLDVARISDDN